MLVVAALGLSGSTVATVSADAPAKRPSARAVIENWQVGYRAGTTQFQKVAGATCRPKDGSLASDRRCKIVFSGKFVSTDRGYKGTYSGSAMIEYYSPADNNAAAFTSGSITYTVRTASGAWVGTTTLAIDLGTGGVYGYPYDLSISYWYEERSSNDELVLRSEGVGVNQLDANLKPIRTFIDRLAFN